MELLFQNRYVLTQEGIIEFSKKATPAWKRIFLFPLFILIMGCGMYLLTDELHELVFCCVLAVYFFVLFDVQSRRSDKILYSRYALNKCDTLERVIEFSDSISVISPGTGGRNVYDYVNVYKFYESKNFYILMLAYSMGVCVEKDKFTIGNESEFKAFLKSQCVHLQNIKI